MCSLMIEFQLEVEILKNKCQFLILTGTFNELNINYLNLGEYLHYCYKDYIKMSHIYRWKHTYSSKIC